MSDVSNDDTQYQPERNSWSAEKLWDLRFCARHRLPVPKAASFLGRSENEVRTKAAELGLVLLEEVPVSSDEG